MTFEWAMVLMDRKWNLQLRSMWIAKVQSYEKYSGRKCDMSICHNKINKLIWITTKLHTSNTPFYLFVACHFIFQVKRNTFMLTFIMNVILLHRGHYACINVWAEQLIQNGNNMWTMRAEAAAVTPPTQLL